MCPCKPLGLTSPFSVLFLCHSAWVPSGEPAFCFFSRRHRDVGRHHPPRLTRFDDLKQGGVPPEEALRKPVRPRNRAQTHHSCWCRRRLSYTRQKYQPLALVGLRGVPLFLRVLFFELKMVNIDAPPWRCFSVCDAGQGMDPD